MEIVTNGVAIILTVFYGVLFSGEFRRKDQGLPNSSDLRWIWATVSIHLVALVMRGIWLGFCPVASRWETLSLLALLIILMHLILLRISGDRSTLVFGIGITFLLQLGSASFTLGESTSQDQVIDSMSSLHAFTAWIGVAGVTIAGEHGVLWLLLRRSIQTSNFGTLFRRLSSLEALSRLIRGSNIVAAISLAITCGSALFLGMESFKLTEPVIFSALCLILVGGFALVPRSTGTVTAWRAWISVVGLCGVVFIITWVIRFGPHSA